MYEAGLPGLKCFYLFDGTGIYIAQFKQKDSHDS